MSDGTRRDFMKKAGITGAVLLTYVAPVVETFKISDAWADEEDGRDMERHDKGRRHPSKKKKGWHGGGGLGMERSED